MRQIAEEWELEGWRPWEWSLGRSVETGSTFQPEIGPLNVAVPGDVRTELARRGIIPDPYVGTNSRAAEFIEHRHWIYRLDIGHYLDHDDADYEITLDSVEAPAQVYFAGELCAVVGSTHLACTFTIRQRDSQSSILEVVLLEPPQGLGQLARTDEIPPTRPRFAYGWDWVPRMVQVGIPGHVFIRRSDNPSLRLEILDAHLNETRAVLVARVDATHLPPETEVQISLTHRGRSAISAPVGQDGGVKLEFEGVHPWDIDSPNLYEVAASARLPSGDVVESVKRRVGFSSVRWQLTPAATPADEPWLLWLNNRRISIVGVNWVPIRPDSASVGDAEYEARLAMYKDLGFNLIRVWGGAGRERDRFYELCDELGLLVWQDLPLSSSALNNTPPSDVASTELLQRIAREWRARLEHHPSLLIWCGGNELTTHSSAIDRPGTPVTPSHPALAAALNVLAAGNRWKVVASTPSGPRFGWSSADAGKGLHHDVHGPWAHSGSDAAWIRLWTQDDARFRSEVGIAGASPIDIIERFGLSESVATWRHSSSWWLDGSEEATARWIGQSQQRQQRLLVEALRSVLRRRESCGGIVFWLGHDSFPCAVSLSLLDFWGRPKPAAVAISHILNERE